MNEYTWIDDWIDNFHNIYLFHIYVFSTLGQQWLTSTPCTRRGRPETTTGGFLLPRATPLLLPCARRWEAPAAAAPLLLPRVCRRWEPPVVVAPLLLPPPTRMTQWRCGWRLLLRHASGCARWTMTHWRIISMLKVRRGRTGGRRRAKAPKAPSLLLARFQWLLVYDLL
jgi:hypothetical protein